MITIKGVTGSIVGGDVVRVEVHKSTPVDISDIHGEKVGGYVVNVITSQRQKIDTLIRDLKPFLQTLSEEHKDSMEQSLQRLLVPKVVIDKNVLMSFVRLFCLPVALFWQM